MYTPVIGLEIHVQANTKSKMFCSCSANYFGAEPNSHVCPVCLGLPGALPVPNKAAIEKCIKIALALNCNIHEVTKFDRKNYFYPDLPKAYQISQYDLPFGYNGKLDFFVNGQPSSIRIRRVHQEEDTGKSIHDQNKTLLDYNKSGVPLMEIVTEPDFSSMEQVTAFAKMLRQTVIYTGVSDAEMQKGQMRFELNISVRTNEPEGELPNYRVEVKNIGSISALEKVLEYEVARQTEILKNGGKLTNETRGIRDLSGATVPQRTKETEDDYRYFPEPDIPPIHVSAEWQNQIKATIQDLPYNRWTQFVNEFGIDHAMAEVLTDQKDKGDWLKQFIAQYPDVQIVKEAAKWVVGEISGLLEKNTLNIQNSPVTISDLSYLVTGLKKQELSGSSVKQVLQTLFASGGTAQNIVESAGLIQTNNDDQTMEWINQAKAQNPDIVANMAKNPNAGKALVGKVMAISGGKANPARVMELIG